MARRFWIAEIRISDAVEAKIRERRGVTGEQVRRACIPQAYDRAGWHWHPEHGRRLLVSTRCDGMILSVILQPVDQEQGIWRLRTVLRR